MLSLFRWTVFLLVLPFLAATATVDLSPAHANVTSLHAKLSLAEIKHGLAPVRISFVQIKRNAAELEDGPEGEEAPLANLVRAYDGDDQIETSLGFVAIAFSFPACAPNLNRAPPPPRHSACAGFPTGPPAI